LWYIHFYCIKQFTVSTKQQDTVDWVEEHPAGKKMEYSGSGMVISLEQGAYDLHMVQLMSLPAHQLLLL